MFLYNAHYDHARTSVACCNVGFPPAVSLPTLYTTEDSRKGSNRGPGRGNRGVASCAKHTSLWSPNGTDTRTPIFYIAARFPLPVSFRIFILNAILSRDRIRDL